MPSSGVSVPDECLEIFETMKLRKKERCMIFVIDVKKMEFKILKKINKLDDQKNQYESIVQNEINTVLGMDKDQKPKGTFCYVVWDLKMLAKSAGKSGQETNLLVFMGICLDDMNVKEKLMYAASREILKEKLTGISKVVEVKTMGDLDYESVMEVLK